MSNSNIQSIGKLVAKILDGAIEATPLSAFKAFLDTDGDGKVTLKDLRGVDYTKLFITIGVSVALIYFKIINVDTLLQLISSVL